MVHNPRVATIWFSDLFGRSIPKKSIIVSPYWKPSGGEKKPSEKETSYNYIWYKNIDKESVWINTNNILK